MANPTLLDMPIARDGNKNTIPTTDNGTTGLLSQQYGWQLINAIPPQQGGKAVKREDFNGVFNLLSNILFYAQKGWQWEFDETQSYFAGCTVKDTADGKTYVCIADVNASTTHPSSDTTHWQLLDLATKGDLANYLPLSGGYMTGSTGIRNAADNDALSLYGAPNRNDGSYISLYGNQAATTGIDLVTFGLDSQGNRQGPLQLSLRANGELSWNGTDVGGSAIVARSLSGTGYVKYASGFTIQWGILELQQGVRTATGSFPISFSDVNSIRITGNIAYTGGGERSVNIVQTSASTLSALVDSAITTGNVGISYIAVGK